MKQFSHKAFIVSLLVPTLAVNALLINTSTHLLERTESVCVINDNLQRTINVLESNSSDDLFFFGDESWKPSYIPLYNIALSDELQQYTYIECASVGIENYYEVVLATMWQESNFNTHLISSTNDYGLMQINKINHTWLSKELGTTDFLDPYQSIKAGVHILASLLLKYGDPHKALMAYNYGEAGAQRFWDAGTYTSSYSLSVTEKQKELLQKQK